MVFGHPEMSCQDVLWSPDGRRLLFAGFEREPAASPGTGRLDFDKPFGAAMRTTESDIEELFSPPSPYRLDRLSKFDWR
jgi:hypothetical protein